MLGWTTNAWRVFSHQEYAPHITIHGHTYSITTSSLQIKEIHPWWMPSSRCWYQEDCRWVEGTHSSLDFEIYKDFSSSNLSISRIKIWNSGTPKNTQIWRPCHSSNKDNAEWHPRFQACRGTEGPRFQRWSWWFGWFQSSLSHPTSRSKVRA